ncbi:MAG: hypothetical protein HY904_19140 [Deltaproteobacteria bacterium]|nr:hypothetical protein [Deltaproteobacteria bacterium]
MPPIKPETFSATLEGANVTPVFHPCPGCVDPVTVTIPGAQGRYTLKLAVDGATSSARVATDTDRLVFHVSAKFTPQ